MKMHVKTMHLSERGKRARVTQDGQSMIPVGNNNVLKESADCGEESRCVDQSIRSISQRDKITTTQRISSGGRKRDRVKNSQP